MTVLTTVLTLYMPYGIYGYASLTDEHRRPRFCYLTVYSLGGTRYRSWLRHYVISRKVAGSIPDEVTGFFNLPNTFFFIWLVRLLALRPLLAYCASLG
jgi:hypothetical protein